MEWRDLGVLIGLRRHGETSVIAELMTRGHGRWLGLVRGGRSRRMQAVLQPGNVVEAVWRARLEGQLGNFALEPIETHAAAALANPWTLHGINSVCALLRLFAERDAHSGVYDATTLVLRHLSDQEIGPPLMARFELAVLAELGFGLDLARCGATGVASDLAYVSPKSGRAVSRAAGEPWKDRLFALPDFLKPGCAASPAARDVADAFRITGHFLHRDVLAPRGLVASDSRRAYVALLPAFEISR